MKIGSVIYLTGSKESLASSSVFMGVSILPNSPLLTEAGSRAVVNYLADLPQPSLIFLADMLNRHNVIGMGKFNKSGKAATSESKAIQIALKEGDKYHDILSKAIKALPAAKANKVTLLRWADLEDDVMRKQQSILRHHYNGNPTFKQRVGKY